jgi:hypothetical protein
VDSPKAEVEHTHKASVKHRVFTHLISAKLNDSP